MVRTHIALALIAGGALLFGASGAFAEPYLAVQTGFKCAQCHVNPTGGGLRNEFGNAFALSQLAASRIDTDSSWLGKVGELLSLGGDLRTAANVTDTPNQEQTRSFDLQELRIYAQLNVIPNRLGVYVDQLVAPGSGLNREAYARYTSADRKWYAKAGQMYLPFGLRLEDDSAFTRQVAGINMTTPDTGVELGLENDEWSLQLAMTNGSAGGTETDIGKQYSLQTVYTASVARLGVGVSFNDSELEDRTATTVFAGLKTGPIAWLAEVTYVMDDASGTSGSGTPNAAPPSDRSRAAGLLEGNWRLAQGHNLKLTAESFDPNRDVYEDQQARYSAVYEYSPIQFLQMRGGLRYYDGIPQSDLQNRRLYFIELHGFY